VADGKDERKKESTPLAHPTNTDADAGTRHATREAAPEGTDERDPEKPNVENLATIFGSDINNLIS
jgi:hypothetical protein